jgi:hypothetical protein
LVANIQKFGKAETIRQDEIGISFSTLDRTGIARSRVDGDVKIETMSIGVIQEL